MGTAWRVHTWQLNVGVGDSAIHLLVDEADGLGGGNKPRVERAVLIDGGKGKTSSETIANAITMIERQYTFPSSAASQLRFDSIVITHWDSDHYEGIQALLEKDYGHQIENNSALVKKQAETKQAWMKDMLEHAGAPVAAGADVDKLFAARKFTTLELVKFTDELLEAGKGPWEYIETLDERITIRSRYMKYGSAYPSDPNFVPETVDHINPVVPIPVNQLLTTLYVPYGIADTLIGPPVAEKDRSLSMASNLDRRYVSWEQRLTTDRTNRNWLACRLDLSFRGAAPFIARTENGKLSTNIDNVKNVRTKTWRILYSCKVAADWQDYLGTELFFGTPRSVAYDENQVTNPAELLKLANLLHTDGPRMYCIAGDQVVLGNLPLAQYAALPLAQAHAASTDSVVTPPGHHSTLTNHVIPLERGGPVRHVIDPKALSLGQRWTEPRVQSHEKNSASLVCVILASTVTDWATVHTATQMKDSFRVLLYTAGDALYDEEGAVVSWLHNRTAMWPVKPVSVVKVSHHGAKQSTPTNMLDLLEPGVLVVSNPDNVVYMHPSPEWLYYIDAHIAAVRRASKNTRNRPLLCTNYPQYLDPLYAPSKINLDAFHPIAVLEQTHSWPELQFVNTLLAKYQEAALAVSNLWTLYQDSQQDLTRDFSSLDTATRLDLKNAVTNNVTARWAELSPEGAGTNVVRAWITVVGNDTLDADMQKHRVWRGDDTITQVYDGTHVHDAEFPQPTPAQPGGHTGAAARKVVDKAKQLAADRARRLAMTAKHAFTGLTVVMAGKAKKPGAPGVSNRDRLRKMKTASAFNVQPMDLEADDQGVRTSSSFDPMTYTPAKSSTPNPPKLDVDMVDAETHSRISHATHDVAGPAALRTGVSIDTGSNPAPPHALPAPTPTSSPYILYSALYETRTASATDASLELGPLNDFVSNLDSGYLALTTPFTATSSTSAVSSEDAWMQWLSVGALQISNLTVTGTVDTVAHITSVGADTSLFGSTLAFTTASPIQAPLASAALTAPVPPGPTTSAASATTLGPAFLADYQLMVLGLAASNPRKAVQVKDILETFGPTWLADLGKLPSIGNQFDLILDANSGRRNALCFQPDGGTAKHLRLEFDAPHPDQLSVHLGFMGTVTLTNTYLVSKIVGTLHAADPGATAFSDIQKEIGLQTTVAATNGGSSCTFNAWFDFKPDRIDLVLTFPMSGTVEAIITWLLASLPADLNPSPRPADFLPRLNFIKVHQISITLSHTLAVLSASVLLEVTVFDAVFKALLNYPELRLTADLWTVLPPSFNDYNLRMVPWWEEHTLVAPFVPQNVTGGVSLMSLFAPGTPTPPHGIEPILTEAHFEVSQTPEKKISLSFSATVTSASPDDIAVPTIELGELKLVATYQGAPAQDPQASSFDVQLSTKILLFPRNFSVTDPTSQAGEIDVSVEYDGSWKVIAEAEMLQFAALYDLFDVDAGDTVMDMLEQLSIPAFRAEYDYSHGSHLSITGTLRVHTLDLDLAYEYKADGTWAFFASLHTIHSSPGHPNEIFLSDLIKDFDPQSEIAAHLSEVPFIGQIGLPSVSADAGAFEDAPVQLKVCKSESAFILWFRIEIDSPAGALSFLFVQYHAAPPAPAAGGSGAGGTPSHNSGSASGKTRPKPKRLLRIQLNKLPKFPSIPIVGNIPQPVDSIDYVLVQDSAASALKEAGGDATPGFTREEIKSINDALPGDVAIQVRDTQSSLGTQHSSAGSTPSYVLLAGHHFIVIAERKIVLDHIFGGAQQKAPDTKSHALHHSTGAGDKPSNGVPGQLPLATSPSSGTAVERLPGAEHKSSTITTVTDSRKQIATAPPEPSVTSQDSGPTMGAHAKTLGLLTLHNLGVQVKDDHLFLIVDATVLLGPIQFTLMGFAIGFPLKLDPPRKLSFNHLSDLEISDFQIRLAGLDVYFNAPPVLIAGYFEHKKEPSKESFRGGLTVGIKAYVVMAVGAYEHTFEPDFKSVFLFGRLDGPLLTLEFAELSGVELGFAYNYEITTPDPGQVGNFPLIHGPAASNNPMDLITSDPGNPTSFSNWQVTKQDMYWFALGVKVDSFQILTADVAMLFAFGVNMLKIAIIGLASAALPPIEGQKPTEAFLYAELGIIATIDVFGGALLIGAQLTPNSYVLAPDCHLTGGFALRYWFNPSLHVGDWVFTVGGFHPAFNPPEYYGVPPPRVGINWSVNGNLSVTGGAFFAICPKACMGGGNLDAYFSAGPVYCSFTAYASFLVNFKPFFFIADMGFEVEAGFHGHIGIIHFNIHASIGASLHLTGPPFAGTVYINLWIHTFSVDFGNQNNTPPPLPWEDFLEQVAKPGPGSPDTPALIVCAYIAGAVTDTKADPKTEVTPRATGDKWFVRAGSFKFRIECKFPMNKMIYGDGTKTTTANPPSNDIYSRLMETPDKLLSVVEVTIKNLDDPTHFSSEAADKDNQFLVTPTFKRLPKALWQQYDRAQDPTQAGNSIDSILNSNIPGTIDHLVGFAFESPNPKLPSFNLPVFNAAAAMEEGVFQDGAPKAQQLTHPILLPGDIDERPMLHPTPAPQTTDLAALKSPNVDQTWTDAATVWKSPVDLNAAQSLADTWTALMGWATPSAQGLPPPLSTDVKASTLPMTSPAPAPMPPPSVGVAGLPPRPLIGTPPTELIQYIDIYYLGCPWISAVA